MPWLFSNSLMRLPSRWFHLSAIKSEQNLPKNNVNSVTGLDSVPLRKADKYLLVWSGKYKKLAEVPDRLSRASIAKAHSVCRVKFCNYMIAATILAAIGVIISGKRDAARGVTRSELGRQRTADYIKKLEAEEQKDTSKS